MRHLMLLTLAVLILGLDRPEQSAFKTARANDARTVYEREVKKAKDDYDARVLKAAKTYTEALLRAKNVATRSGDLDEANALQAEMNDLDPSGQRAGGELLITRARWGIGESWADLTSPVRSATHDRGMFPIGQLPDPANGRFKTLIVEGSYGSRPFVFFYDSQAPQGNFYFGKPIPLPPK